MVNDTPGLTRNQIKDLLLEKEKFWIGTIVTQHYGLNSTHHWNHSKRTEREKINTVEPVYSGRLRFRENLSAIARCPLHRGSFFFREKTLINVNAITG